MSVRSEAGMVSQEKLKRRGGSKVNTMAAKTSVKASLPSLHDKSYLSLYFAFPKPSWRTLH